MEQIKRKLLYFKWYWYHKVLNCQKNPSICNLEYIYLFTIEQLLNDRKNFEGDEDE